MDAEKQKPNKKPRFSAVICTSLDAAEGGNGSASWTRTNDPVINSHLLYQLSY